MSALAQFGSVKKAADRLFTSQSALSHQLKELESRLDTKLFIRNSSPICFTQSGQILVELSEKILPELAQTAKRINTVKNEVPTLSIALACHACFKWLLPIANSITLDGRPINIELLEPVFSEIERVNIDIVLQDHIGTEQQLMHFPIGNFELAAVVSVDHQLASKAYLEPQDFIDQRLLTYPVEASELDIYQLFLDKQGVVPKQHKRVNSSHVMLQMAAANMGIAILPLWLINSINSNDQIRTIKLGQQGIEKSLTAAYRQDNANKDLIELMLPNIAAAFDDLKHSGKAQVG